MVDFVDNNEIALGIAYGKPKEKFIKLYENIEEFIKTYYNQRYVDVFNSKNGIDDFDGVPQVEFIRLLNSKFFF